MQKRSTINSAVGQVIREVRNSKNIAQEKMALDSNIDRTYASALERGLKNPSIEVILKLAEGLNYPAWEIVKRVEELLNNK